MGEAASGYLQQTPCLGGIDGERRAEQQNEYGGATCAPGRNLV
jgi:hypothetical protein